MHNSMVLKNTDCGDVDDLIFCDEDYEVSRR